MDVDRLLDELAHDLRPVEDAIRAHPLLAALEAGEADPSVLRRFVAEQELVLRSDRRSFAQLAARFPEDPSGAFFLRMADGEGEALAHLAALGPPEAGYEPRPGCQAYPAFVAWLALNGGRADVAVAFLVNLDAWGTNCARMGAALRDRYSLPVEATRFFEFFASPPPGFREEAIAVAADGLARGEPVASAGRAARLLQAYELQFWDALWSG